MHKLTKSQLNLPGVCLRCNTSENRDWFLDTDIYLDFIGNAYICNMCIVDFFNAAGGLTAEAAADLDKLHTEMLRELEANYEQEIEELRGIQLISHLSIAEIVDSFAGYETRIKELERSERELPVGNTVDPEPTVDDPTDEPDGDSEPDESPDDEPDFLLAVADGTVTGLDFRF